MNRCLITSCTDRKTPGESLLPAIDRYDGPTFRVVRKYCRTLPPTCGRIKVLVVSAEFGLLEGDQPIRDYDRQMTEPRAIQLQPQVVRQLREQLSQQRFGEIFLLLGKKYHQAIDPVEDWVPNPSPKIITAAGGMGQKLQELHQWLYCLSEPKCSSQQQSMLRQATWLPDKVAGSAILRGVVVNDSPEQIEAKATQWIAEGDEQYLRTKKWVAVVGNFEVAPKWLVSRLSGVPVRDFGADDARRVLRQLGISTIPREQ